MSFISSLKTDVAKAISTLVAFGHSVENTVLPALKQLDNQQAVIEGVTGLISPAAKAVEIAAFNVLDLVITAIEDSSKATTDGGVNLTLDAAVVADIKKVIAAIRGLSGVTKT
jgi:hypothetical protein